MRRNIFKKATAAILAASMMISLVLTGCGNEEKPAQSSTSSETQKTSEAVPSETKVVEEGFQHDPGLNELGVEPFSKEKVTLTVMIRQYANVEDYETNTYTKMIEEAANVDLEFLEIPSDQFAQKVRLMASAGGDDLPDLIIHPLANDLVMELAENEMIIPLNEYYENCSIHFKSGFERVLEDKGIDVLRSLTFDDGNVYTVPSYEETYTNTLPGRIWVYGPWLEAVGMKAEDIVTTEDFYNMLYAFKTQDPNGNGKADEIPALSSSIERTSTDTGGAFIDAMMSAFVRSTSPLGYLNLENDKLSVAYDQEGWKEGTKYIASLIEAGLYDPSSLTTSIDSFKTIMNSEGDQLVGCFAGLSPSYIQKTHSSYGKWVLLTPLTGPDGTCTTPHVAESAYNYGFITKNCKNPELAFRILDLMGREDFTITTRWGIQGKHWDYVEDLKKDPKYKDVKFDQTFAGYPAYIYAYGTQWGVPQNDHWHGTSPDFRTEEVACGYYAANMTFADESDYNLELGKKFPAYEAVAPKQKLAKIKYPSDILVEATELGNSLMEYVRQSLAQWLTGAADVDADWEKYLAQLEKLGLARYLELTQEAYERTK